MFRKILIANRGEIALRVLRACRTLGIEAVVVYSEADRESLPVQLADEAICIGPADARRSYLSAPAGHFGRARHRLRRDPPGYGFLSEDEGFADVVAAHGLTFIGPPADVLERFGSKEATRRLLGSHGLPTIPGPTACCDDLHALGEAERIGYPVLIKPSAGGGGKGMRMVRTARELDRRCASAAPRRRPRSATTRSIREVARREPPRRGPGGGRPLRARRPPRRARLLRPAPPPEDHRGGPTPALTTAAREDLADRAIRAVVAAGYENIGTLEFLVDRDDNPYFIEINCRIQVEHPVTEMLTGIDLIATQIRIARRAARVLAVGRGAARPRDRVPHQRRGSWRTSSARDGRRRALPRARRARGPDGLASVRGLRGPAVLRLALGKLIVWGLDREAAIARGRVALDELLVEGIATNVSIHKALLANEAFLEGHMTTNLLDRVGAAAPGRRRSPVTVFSEPAVRGGCCVQGVEHSERGP